MKRSKKKFNKHNELQSDVVQLFNRMMKINDALDAKRLIEFVSWIDILNKKVK